MSETYSHIEEACKIILSATFDLQAENDKYKNIFNLKSVMFKSVSDENTKLKRLLAEACDRLDKSMDVLSAFNFVRIDENIQPDELSLWWSEHKKFDEERNNNRKHDLDGK